MGFKTLKLKDVCSYSNDRIKVDVIDVGNYISTENLLPDKKGKVEAGSLPMAKSVVKYAKGDTLISNIRPYFRKIWYSGTEGGASADVLVFKADTEKVDSKYLYYLLSQNKIFDYMVQTSKGTKMPRGDKSALMNYEISLPQIKQQKNVAELLSKMDEKISVNDKEVSTLEQLTQTLFNRWFVDFEFPNENGEPYKSSGGEMVESEFGMIPTRWKVKSLDEIAVFTNGLAMQRFRPEDAENSLPVLKIKELRQGRTDGNSDRCSVNIKDSVKIFNGDVIFSWSATLLVKFWYGDNAGLNQHLFKVTSDDYPKWLYYQWTKRHLEHFKSIALDKATTMGHINRSHLSESKVVIPDQKQMKEFAKYFSSLNQLVIEKGLETHKLEDLRDMLLPKLLSGEIEIPDETEVTENVPIS